MTDDHNISRIADLAVSATRGLMTPQESLSAKEPKAVYGLRPFAPRGGIVTNELIDKLREDDAY